MVRSKDDLKKAISIAFEHSDTIIIEDFIEGREFRCSVIEKCVDGEIEVIAMPPMEYLIDTKGIRDAGQKIIVDEHGLPVGKHLKEIVIQQRKKKCTFTDKFPVNTSFLAKDSDLAKKIQMTSIAAHKLMKFKDLYRKR